MQLGWNRHQNIHGTHVCSVMSIFLAEADWLEQLQLHRDNWCGTNIWALCSLFLLAVNTPQLSSDPGQEVQQTGGTDPGSAWADRQHRHRPSGFSSTSLSRQDASAETSEMIPRMKLSRNVFNLYSSVSPVVYLGGCPAPPKRCSHPASRIPHRNWKGGPGSAARTRAWCCGITRPDQQMASAVWTRRWPREKLQRFWYKPKQWKLH